jgi:virginiamycin B lyase
VDEADMVWLSDFTANALVRFDPGREAFDVFSHPQPNANVRQMLGRPAGRGVGRNVRAGQAGGGEDAVGLSVVWRM